MWIIKRTTLDQKLIRKHGYAFMYVDSWNEQNGKVSWIGCRYDIKDAYHFKTFAEADRICKTFTPSDRFVNQIVPLNA